MTAAEPIDGDDDIASPQDQICTFLLDGMAFGIEVTRVQEVIRNQEMTPVPLAPPVIAGLINLRGQIVTAVDLRRRLGMALRASGEPMNVVVRRGDGPISLLVDEIGDVVDVDERRFEAAPATLSPDVKALVRGVYKLDDRLLLLLDIDSVTTIEINSLKENHRYGE